MRQTGNDNLIWHLSCQQDDQIWWMEMNMPENCGFLHNWRMKINFSKQKSFKKSVFHRLVNLFTLRSRPGSSARLVFTHVAIWSSLMLLFQGHVAQICVVIGCTFVWSSSQILGIKLINNYSLRLNGLWVNSPWGWRPNWLLTQRPWGQGT